MPQRKRAADKVDPRGFVTKAQKPPLGVMPKALWLEARAVELTRAMSAYAALGEWDEVAEWGEELRWILSHLGYMV